MFKFVDRYILKEIIPPFFIGLLVYSFVLLMNQVFLLSELFIAKGVAFRVVVLIFLYLIPSVLAFTIPMSVLMGILAGLSRLSSDSEVVAFRSLGISNARILRPILVFAFGGWLITSYLTLYLAPQANYRWVQTLARSVLAKVQLKIIPREFNDSIPDAVIFIQDITQDNQWKNIFVYLTRSGEEPRAIFARRGRLNFYPEVKRATLELYDGSIHTVPAANPERYSLTLFGRTEEEISVETLFAQFSSEKRVREKDIGELFKDLKRIGAGPVESGAEKKEIDFRLFQRKQELRAHGVEIHKKFALPFVCFVFVLMGIPLGMSTKKGGRTGGFTISLAIILIYYVLITAGEKTAMDGKISPFLGMWGPNFIYLTAGAYLFFRSSKEYAPLRILSRAAGKSDLKTVVIRIRLSPPFRSLAALGRPRLSLRFPNILDRYVMRKYLGIFVLTFLALLSVSVIVTFFERIDNIYEHNKPFSLLFTYIQYRIPEFMHYILPVTALTTTLLTLGLLTKSNEVTAMKACGISVYRLILAVVFLAILSSLFALALQERLLPFANKKAEEVWNRILDQPPRSYSFLDRRWVLSRDKERIFHYRYYDPATKVFSQLSVFDLDLAFWSLERRIFAEKATLGKNALSLLSGWSRKFGGMMSSEFEVFQRTDLRLKEDEGYFAKERKEPALMSYGELKRYVAEIDEIGFETTRFKVDLSSKLSFPLVPLIMTLIGIPFAFSMGRRGTLAGLGLSVAIAMVYWGTIGVFQSLGYVGFLSAFLASWGPNLIFGLAALYLLFRLRT